MLSIGLEQTEYLIKQLKKQSFAVFANTASVNNAYRNIIDILFEIGLIPTAILGPQHGFIQDKQDNMKESPDSVHPIYRIPIFSLYGDTRIPQDYMLKDAEVILIDIQDVGARYYTYISSLFYLIKKAKELSKKLIILDRPNPISSKVEGNLVESEFESFVGIYPISNRHGMTIGEIALMFNSEIGADIEILKIKNYKKKYWDELDIYAWIPTSPNMPRFETTLVYPGQCLLEATNISEGRGTTTPFEVFGAPFIKHTDFINSELINKLDGVYFRPVSFVPTFNKYEGILCNGFYLHIINRDTFKPLKTSLAIIYLIYNTYKEFKFLDPPYEYEYHKMPIDVLLGADKVRLAMEQGASFEEVYKLATENEDKFLKKRKQFLLY